MTSSRAGTFVFVHLPSTEEVVVAGRFELERGTAGDVGHFVYGRSYLDRTEAIALDPIHLPLVPGEFRTTLNHGLFGALRDSAPDYWGRVVIERTHAPATELDYLLATADVRVGALSFAPTPEPPRIDYGAGVPMDQLERAAAAAAAVEASLAGERVELDLDPALLDASSGVGGARPKTMAIDATGQLWIAKFPARMDRWDNAIVEATCLRLAELCGIRTPECRVLEAGDRRILLVRRFDQRPGPIRRPFLSAHTLLGLDDTVVGRADWSYVDFAHLLRRVSTRPEEDALELYRRVIFNALISNTDDHPRNHAVLWDTDGWRLSPAYDLTPSVGGIGRGEDQRLLAMSFGQLRGVEPRWSNRHNLLSAAEHFGYTRTEADELISEMKAVTSEHWREVVLEVGGRPGVADQVAHAFIESYPGFEYEPGH